MSLSLATVAADVLRRNNYRGGRRTILLENTDANLCPRSEDLSTWTKSSGTGTATGGQVDPYGGTTAYKLDDQDVGVDVDWSSPNFAAYAGAHTTRGFSWFYDADTAAECEVGIFNNTAATYLARIRMVPVAGVLTAAGINFSVGTGRVVAVIPVTSEPGHYRVLAEVDNVVVANSHKFVVRPAGAVAAATGASILWGFYAHQAASPGRTYYPNPNASGSTTPGQDILRIPTLVPPGATTFYARYYETGAQSRAVREGTSQRVLTIGDVGNTPPRFLLYFLGGTDQPRVQHTDAASISVTSLASGFPTLAFGDRVELLGVLYQDGSVQLFWSVNGSATVAATRSSAKAFPAAWAADGLLTSQRLQPFSGAIWSGQGEVEVAAVFPGNYTVDEARALTRVV